MKALVRAYTIIAAALLFAACGQVATPTPTPTVAVVPSVEPTVTPVVASGTTPPESYIKSVDLSSFVAAWTSGDVAAIRSLYTDDARYFSEEDVWALRQEQPFSVLVHSDGFAARIQEHKGFRMRVLGQPIGVHGKLVAFAYRLENDSEGYNGVALLRYEGSLILLHVYLISSERTPNQTDDSRYFEPVALDALMRAWNAGDAAGAQAFYSKPAAILSDEDLAQAPWRDFARPTDVAQVIPWFRGWSPAVVGTPKRIGDLVIFAWRWETRVYPAGFGVRVLRYDGDVIAMDIRFAIRPWEISGKAFMTP